MQTSEAQPPWPAKEAERKIREYMRGDPDLTYTRHAKERLQERGIIISDVFYILEHGDIEEEKTEETSREGLYKYKICSKSPNSGNREICLIIIPSINKPAVKVITVMWKDIN